MLRDPTNEAAVDINKQEKKTVQDRRGSSLGPTQTSQRARLSSMPYPRTAMANHGDAHL